MMDKSNCISRGLHPAGAPHRRPGDYPYTPYIFVTERKESLSTSTVHKLVTRVGKKADLDFPVHPRMLRRGVATSWQTISRIPARSSITWDTRI